MITRYILAQDPLPVGLQPLTAALERRRELGSGWLLLRTEFRDVRDLLAAQALDGITVLPSLQTPADRLSQKMKSWLVARGVAVERGDTVLNVVRKLRDASPGRFFDISLPD